MKRTLTAVLLSLALPAAGGAASAGGDPFNFLFLDAGARPVALGGAYTALARDANALHYNPAGLTEVKRDQALFMHNQYFGGITQEYAAYVSPARWGVALNYLDFGTARRTTVSNPTGAGLGRVGLTDVALSAGMGAILTNDMVGGAAVKLLRENVAGVPGQAAALDLGVMYFPPGQERLVFGAAAQNIGTSVKFKSATEKLPQNLRLGAAYNGEYRGRRYTLALDLAKARAEDMVVAAGAEAVFSKVYAVRLGYSGRNDAGAGITVGAGYQRGDLNFDYAFVPFGDLGAAHRLSVGFRWTPVKKAAVKAAPKRSHKEIAAEEFARLTAAAKEQAARQNYAKAAMTYEQALLLEPGEPAASMALAELYMRVGRFADADAALEGAYARLPSSDERIATVLERRGEALFRLEKYPAAKKLFQRAIKFAEDNDTPGTARENAYFGLAWCFEKQESFEDALRNYRIALQLTANESMRKMAQTRIGMLEVGRR